MTFDIHDPATFPGGYCAIDTMEVDELDAQRDRKRSERARRRTMTRKQQRAAKRATLTNQEA